MMRTAAFLIALLSLVVGGAGAAFAQTTPFDAPAAAQSCTLRTDWPTYTVQLGDTLYNISRRAGTTVDALKAGNCLTSNLIVVGTTLYVPTAIGSNGPMIDIQTPASGATLTPNQSFTVSGQARALFEGGLVVQVRDNTNSVIAETPVTASGGVATGGTGPWSTSFTVNLPAGTSGQIYAYAISARDGSVAASDFVNVMFGTAPGGDVTPMIDIQTPASGATLTPNQPFTVSGQARALFEGGLVVQVRNASNSILAEQAITAGGDVAIGGTGPWSTSFSVGASAGMSGSIYAYATSARDGSIVAEDQVNVTFGATPPDDSTPMIDIQTPASGSTIAPNQPFTVSGQARALFEGGLVVQVRDNTNSVIAETPVTAGGDVATGGTGPWSTSFTVNLPAGTPGQIYAYATSARDGTLVASDFANVTFGSGTGCSVRTDWPTHTVQAGENLYRIGLRYNVTVTTLANANCLDSPGLIYVGQTLRVPAY